MLKVFRDNLKYLSWVLWAVIAVFILFVFVDFGATVPGGSLASDSAAVVGKHEISYGEFERAYRNAESFYRQIYGEQFNSDLARQIGLPLQVIDGLIADKILLDEAKRMGLTVTDAEVKRTITEQEVFQNDDGSFIGEEDYIELLRANGLTAAGFEASTRNGLLIQRVRDVLADNLYLSEQELRDSYREQVESAKIRFVELPASQFAGQAEPTPEELADYFDSRREDYRIPEQRVIDYLLVDTAAVRDTLEISDAELEAYYGANPDEFAVEEQVRARHILLKTGPERSDADALGELAGLRQRIADGADFATLAMELSDDPGSKAKGGDLGFFGRGQMVRPFEEAAFGASPGELVGPIKSSFGYHLIEVLERRPAGRRPFAEARGQIEARLLAERAASVAESRAGELAERLEKEDVAGGEGLERLALETDGVSSHTTPPFGREDDVEGIGRATAFSVAAFELAAGETSEPVRVPRGWAVLQLAETREPRLPELDEVRDEVAAALAGQRQLELARQALADGREKIAGGASLDDLAAELGLEIEESPEFGRNGSIGRLGQNRELTKAALALDQGAVGGPVALEDSAVLFEVVERTRFDETAYQEAREGTRATLRDERVTQMMNSLIAKRREALTVRYDRQLLANFGLTDQEG